MNTKFYPKWLGLTTVLFLLLAALAPVSPAHADSCLVTTDADSGAGSLREKIANPTCDTITFDGDYTIMLGSHLPVDRDLTIDGVGQSIAIDGNDAVRAFVVNPGVTFNLSNLTVANCRANTFIGPFYDGQDGGGIFNWGTLNATNVVFSGNDGGGMGGWSHGGGLFNDAGTVTLTNTTFSGNGAMFGGGIYNLEGTLNVANSTFSGNISGGGGGILNLMGTATVTNSTFSGSWNCAFATGLAGTATLTNCTVAGNNYGGVCVDSGSTVTLANTVVANNTESNCHTYEATLIGSNGLADDDSCPGSVNSPSILLGPLADNGGLTLTMALLPGSAAIDAGDDAACPATDQRGVTRPQGAHCDIGAYEAEITAGNTAPTANPGGPYLGAINTAISLDGSGSTDPDGDSLTYAWTFDDDGTGMGVAPEHTYVVAGVYDVCLTVNDGTVDSQQACTMAVVYDPSAGFVTGGGWINSPAGAYKADPGMSGQATFGFVSKYKKGAQVPTGNTAFQFDAAGFSFYSETYEWLVVNQGGTNAQFKGSGTVNSGLDPNGNPYKFMIWAADGSPDTLRIRIWWEADGVETDVYDNGIEQAIGAGNIVVHTK